LFFGPAPPEAEAEASLVGAAGRTAAVTEALRASRSGGDAFDVLGVAPDVSAAAIRRAFWRLSLLVHPDKCDHPDAPLAFDVVKKASEALGDAETRAALEAKRAEAANREGFEAWLAEERSRAEWRATRGAPEPGDEALLRGGGADPSADEGGREGGRREAWMTELPEQRRPSPRAPGPGPGGGTARAFARTAFVERDARTAAEWTDAPKDAATRGARLFSAAREARYATTAPRDAEASEREMESRRLVDAHNETRRATSLLERHRERAERDASRRKKGEKTTRRGGGGGGGGGGGEEDDGTGWAYKPWNRETDLEAGRASTKALDAGEMVKKAGGDLRGRFGAGKMQQ
jgi:curved DNA-binding protein CbpA